MWKRRGLTSVLSSFYERKPGWWNDLSRLLTESVCYSCTSFIIKWEVLVRKTHTHSANQARTAKKWHMERLSHERRKLPRTLCGINIHNLIKNYWKHSGVSGSVAISQQDRNKRWPTIQVHTGLRDSQDTGFSVLKLRKSQANQNEMPQKIFFKFSTDIFTFLSFSNLSIENVLVDTEEPYRHMHTHPSTERRDENKIKITTSKTLYSNGGRETKKNNKKHNK